MFYSPIIRPILYSIATLCFASVFACSQTQADEIEIGEHHAMIGKIFSIKQSCDDDMAQIIVSQSKIKIRNVSCEINSVSRMSNDINPFEDIIFRVESCMTDSQDRALGVAAIIREQDNHYSLISLSGLSDEKIEPLYLCQKKAQ